MAAYQSAPTDEGRAQRPGEGPNIARQLPDTARSHHAPQAEVRLPNTYPPDEVDPCHEAEAALNGYLPQTEKLKETASFLAKLTDNPGASVLA